MIPIILAMSLTIGRPAIVQEINCVARNPYTTIQTMDGNLWEFNGTPEADAGIAVFNGEEIVDWIPVK